VLLPQLAQDCDYWRIPARGIQKAVHELEPYKIEVRFFHFDRYSNPSFSRTCRQLKSWKPDGVLLAPVLVEPARALLSDPAFSAPYVFFDSDIPDCHPLCTIGQDPRQSGLLAAHLMRNLTNERGTIALIKVLPEDYHIKERIQGFEEGLREFRKIAVKVYEVDSHGGPHRFQRVCRVVVNENPDLRGVFVSNAWTYPVARSIRFTQSRNSVAVVGYDLVRDNERLLSEGGIDFLISQRPEMQGYQGIYALYRHIVLNERVPRHVMLPLDILTKENLRYYQD
jgi:LacI family transcriptional regulator